jgi:hypothetical protein
VVERRESNGLVVSQVPFTREVVGRAEGRRVARTQACQPLLCWDTQRIIGAAGVSKFGDRLLAGNRHTSGDRIVGGVRVP